MRSEDLRIESSQALTAPNELAAELPVSEQIADFVNDCRETIEAIYDQNDPRILAIVGPCSVHDEAALMEYAQRFKQATEHLKGSVYPILRVYFEKPRTTVGWKGLINDPDLDNSFQINKGLALARKILIEVADCGLPAATEFLDATFGQYYAELISLGAIGARTVESQIHRQLASGLSMPVGFKNGTNGDIDVAIDAILSAREPHWFPSLTHDGSAATLLSTGNPYGFLILRGGSVSGPNYSSAHITAAKEAMNKRDVSPSIIVDCSHGNSEKDHKKQALVVSDLCDQLRTGEDSIRGVMLESHLVAGKQSVKDGVAETYGQSITDACLGFEQTIELLENLASANRDRIG